jgi:predicted TIM-barrel fold metal-dependent hydrolase
MEFECVPTAVDPNYWMRIEQAADGGVPVAIGSGGTTGTGFPDQATAAKQFVLGCNLANTGGTRTGFHKSSIAAVVLVTGTLSTADRDNIRAWCRTRAGF